MIKEMDEFKSSGVQQLKTNLQKTDNLKDHLSSEIGNYSFPGQQKPKVYEESGLENWQKTISNDSNDDQTNTNDNSVLTLQSHTKTDYRPDIDGIRAVAISLVLIYHAFPSKLSGGFIGVDVFFVISGFLITQIIIKEITQQKFSIINFYVRRIKRIYPALIVVLCFAVWVIKNFTSIDLVNFSFETLNSALIFCTNFRILFHKKDYFDADIRGNPLLHLWSLGVEEQFYIVWPVLLMAIFKFKQKSLLKILSIFTFLSFIFSIVCVFINSKFAFYFPLCRFWQMSVGGILGSMELQFRSPVINNILSSLGLILILVTSFIITDQSLFPGFLALLPSFGCVLIIQAKNRSFVSKYILSSSILTFVGKISYSLYLWHWVLIVFSRIYYPHGSTSIFSSMLFIIGLSFVLSIATYFIIENPVRKIRTKKVAIVLLILMGLVGLASFFVGKYVTEKYFSSNESERTQFLNRINQAMTPQPEDYVIINGKKQPHVSFNQKRQLPTDKVQILAQKTIYDYEFGNGGQSVLQKNIDDSSVYGQTVKDLRTRDHDVFAVANEGQQNQLFVIGDSHAQKISHRFLQLFRKSQMKGTLDKFPTVLIGLRRGFAMGQDNFLLNSTRKLAQVHKPKRMFFIWNWIYYFCSNLETPMDVPGNCDMAKLKQYLTGYVNFLLEFQSQGIEVYTSGVDINFVQYKPENMLDANGFIVENMKPFKYSEFRQKYRDFYEEIQGAFRRANIKWIDTAESLCWEDVCHVITPKGYAHFKDIDHMGRFFSRHWFSVVDQLTEF